MHAVDNANVFEGWSLCAKFGHAASVAEIRRWGIVVPHRSDIGELRMSQDARPANLSGMILIGYDGSPDSKDAIKRAGELMRGRPATIVTVWEPLEEIVTRVGAGMPIGAVDYAAIDHSYEEQAHRRAEEGAECARQAGLKAHAQACVRDGSIAETILIAADEANAEAIVLGTRGLTGLKSLLLGSVSHAVLQHADRPVVVVPSPAVAAARAARLA